MASGSSFPSGTTANSFTVTDGSGNTATCSFTVTVNDTEAPTITCPANVVVSNDPGQCAAIVTYSVSFNDNCAGANLAQTAGLASGSSFPSGTTSNSFTVTDGSGNTATCSFTVTVNDTEAPTITCPANVVVSNDPGQCAAMVTYSVSFNDNCAGATLAQTAGLASGSSFPSGTTSNSFTVTDGSGNTATCSFTVTVNDTEGPVLVCQNIQVAPSPGPLVVTPAQVIVSASDNCGISTNVLTPNSFTCAQAGQTITVDLAVTDVNGNVSHCTPTVEVLGTGCNQPPVAICQNVTVNADVNCERGVVPQAFDNGSFDPNGDPLTFTTNPAGPFIVGVTNVVLTVSDGALTSTCSATVTVLDITPPTIRCPLNVSVSNDPGICGAIVGYTAVTGTDDCSGITIVQTSGLISGGTFPIGTTLNGFTATDGAGNSAVCSFEVTVLDTENPILTCPGNLIETVDSGICAAVINYNVVLNDNCPGATLLQISGQPSGATIPLGTVINEFRAVDGAGNTSSCVFSVEVVDLTPPVAVCQNITVSNGINGNFTITPSMINNGSSDGCGIDSIFASQTAFTCSNNGGNVVVLTVTDIYGNTSTCSSIVTILGITPPVITPSGPTVFCSGGSVILNGGAGYNSYMWSNSATTQSITVTTSGYYGLAVVNNNGCIALAVPVAVTVNPSPTPVITASGPTTFCVGGSVTLDAGAGFASYNWSNGATTRTILVNATGNYTVTVTNGPGCPGIASRTVTVNPLPTVNITANNNGIICFGNAVTLTATAGLSTYAWSGGGTAFTKVVTTPGTYTVTVTNAFGCANTASFVVTAVNACQVPTGEFASSITSNGATLNWTAVPCATSYRVQWRRVGTNPYTSRNVSTNSTVITGLLPNTTYEWHVRTTCTGGGGTTAYSALFQFTTLGPQAKGEIGAEAEAAAAPDPMLYPNPNSGKFTLEYFAEVEAHVQICVYDMFGKLVRCETKLASESENTWEMQFDNLSKGMYMLKVEGVEQGLVETQSVRFIVQ
ncbi:MAG: HYR domain-containing protein [Bacteroidetes bacterium]|nr:HYR domain-containing protein [Bacteroidota bacterium]